MYKYYRCGCFLIKIYALAYLLTINSQRKREIARNCDVTWLTFPAEMSLFATFVALRLFQMYMSVEYCSSFFLNYAVCKIKQMFTWKTFVLLKCSLELFCSCRFCLTGAVVCFHTCKNCAINSSQSGSEKATVDTQRQTKHILISINQ